MNANTLQGSAIPLVLAMAGASPVFAADTGTLSQSLGSSSTATDVWQLTCPLGTNHARAYVSDILTTTSNVALVRVKLIKNLTAQKEDASPSSDGEGSSASPDALRYDGAGTYDVIIDKNASGSESYRGYAYCRNTSGNNITAGVLFVRTQNQ